MSGLCWDCLIIGAGPAGSMAALLLARRGLSVLLCERARFPRYKVCGGCLNAESVAMLRSVGVERALADLGAVKTDRMKIWCGRHQVRFSMPEGLAVSRGVLDAALADAAVESGAHFLQEAQARVEAVEEDAVRVSLRHADGSLENVQSRLVLLASGLGRLPVAGIQWKEWVDPHSRLGAGMIVAADCSISPGQINMLVGRSGYVGLVRVEREQINLGAALEPALVKRCGGLAPAVKQVLQEAGAPELPDLDAAAISGAPALTRVLDPVAHRRLLVLGDASGYVEPFTGQGMAWAMRSACLAAPLAERAVRQWDEQIAREWRQIHNRSIQRTQRVCGMLKWALHHPLAAQTLAAAFAVAPWAAAPLVRSVASRPSSCEVPM